MTHEYSVGEEVEMVGPMDTEAASMMTYVRGTICSIPIGTGRGQAYPFYRLRYGGDMWLRLHDEIRPILATMHINGNELTLSEPSSPQPP